MRTTSSRIFASACVLVFVSGMRAQTLLPPGAISLINEDRYGSVVALCADTGEVVTELGAKIRGTGVWVGERSNLQRIQAGPGACDPAWSPDGRRLALTSAEGLWVFPAQSTKGSLRVETRLPPGAQAAYTSRAFSRPRWSPDGVMVALVVTNSVTSWVEVFEASTGRLFYTSPPENDSFSWGSDGRELRLGSTAIHFPSRR